MAKASFEKSLDIRAEPSAVHALLADFEQLQVLHPLIESIRELPAKPERPGARRYRIVDRMRVGPFRYRIAYVAELRVVSDERVEGRAWQAPSIELRTNYRIVPCETGTRLTETTVLTAPWLLVDFVRRQAEAAHIGTLENLRAHLEGEASAATGSARPAR